MTDRSVERIVVTGSECTGKTTLARELARHFGVGWVPEQSRAHALAVGRPLIADDVEPIAWAQIEAEDAGLDRAIRQGDGRLILDTDLLSTVVYSRHYYGACPPWIVAEARRRLADLYLLADLDIPWVGDGVRDRPGAREEIQESFRDALAEFGAHWADVRGLGPDRLAGALAAIGDALPR